MADIDVPGFIPVRQPIDVAAATAYLEGLDVPGFDGSAVQIRQANNGMSNPTCVRRCVNHQVPRWSKRKRIWEDFRFSSDFLHNSE